MRIVMVTDDGHPIDRRILLEGESLLQLGHEVIVIARAESGGETRALSASGIKLLHIDFDLGYLGGAMNAPDLSRLTRSADTDGSASAISPGNGGYATSMSAAAMRTLERHRVRAALLHQRFRDSRVHHRAKHEATLRAWAEKQKHGRSRLLLVGPYAASVAKAAAFHTMFSGLDLARSAYRALARRGVGGQSKLMEVDGVKLAMNAWEEAVLHRLVYFNPDIIHCHDLPQLLPSVLAARQLGIPLVYDAHEIYPEIATLTGEQKSELKIKESVLIHHCDVRITVNPFCARHMEEAYGCDPFDIILNATVPASEGRTSSGGQLRKSLGLPDGARILMYQGWMADVGRGLVQLVEAMTNTPDHIHLVMMGYGDVELFRRIADLNGISQRVHVLPAVPWEELVQWSSGADAGIIPYQPVDLNHYYCSPNKLFEFIAARLPILANDLPFLRQVVHGQGFGLVHPMSDRAETAAAIRAMFDPGDRVLTEARKNLDERAAEWEWSKQADVLQGIYRRLTSRPASSARSVQSRAVVSPT